MTGFDYFVIIAFPLGIIAYWYHYRKQKNLRIESMQKAAIEQNFTFKKTTYNTIDKLKHFKLFSNGHFKTMFNIMEGFFNNIHVTLFDYEHNGDDEIKTQTAVLLTTGIALPHFYLRPKKFGDKVNIALGRPHINFDMYPSFSQNYLLHSADESAIRRLFSQELLTHLQKHQDISLEGYKQQLLYYRHGKTVPSQEIPNFLQEACEIYQAMY